MESILRNECIDIAKGIGIFLVVLGHTNFSDYGESFVNMIHMPLFFFFSGYCFKEKYLHDTKRFVYHRIKGLYYPFIKWSIFFLLLHNTFYTLNIYNQFFGFHGVGSHLLTLREMLNWGGRIFFCMDTPSLLLGAYWFLKVLFITSFICIIVIKYFRNILVYAIPLLIALSCILTDENVPYLIVRLYGRCFLASAVFLTGYLYKQKDSKYENKPMCITLISLLLVPFGTYYYPMRMGDPRGTLIYFFLYYITAIVGVVGLYSISKVIDRKTVLLRKFFVFVGANTMAVLTWHLLCFKFVSYLIIYIFNYSIIHLAEFPVIVERSQEGWWLFYLTAGFGIPVLAVYIKEKLLAFVRQYI